MQTSSRATKAASSNGSRPPVEQGWRVISHLLNRICTPIVVRRLAVITSIGIIITYATGTLVTDSGSGHGCGQSWPLCRGQFIPQFAISTAIEFSHRVVVGLVSVLILAMAIGILWLWRSRRELLILALLMIPALLAEAGLGAALVLEPQSPLLLAVHFASSLVLVTSIVLATLIILELGSWDRLRDRPVPAGFRILTLVLLLYTYVVGYLGAYIRLRGDELGCRSWPLCNGKVIPGFTGPAGIVFSHWFAALFLLAGTLALVLWARSIRAMRPDLYRGSMLRLPRRHCSGPGRGCRGLYEGRGGQPDAARRHRLAHLCLALLYGTPDASSPRRAAKYCSQTQDDIIRNWNPTPGVGDISSLGL